MNTKSLLLEMILRMLVGGAFFTLATIAWQGSSLAYASGDLMAAAQQTYGQRLVVVQAPGVYELWQLRDLNGN